MSAEPSTTERLREMMFGVNPRARAESTVLWAADEIDRLRAQCEDYRNRLRWPDGDDTPNQWEAIRQTVNCPTCDGLRISQIAKPPRPGAQAISATHLGCPDCKDGKIDMARLLAVGAAVFSAEYMNRNQAGEWRPVIVNALPSGSVRTAVFAEQLHDYLLQVKP